MKKLLAIFALLALLSMLVVACGGSTTGTTGNNGGTSATGSNTVNLASNTFSPNSITIKKGESLTLANQTATTHIIANGSWNGDTPAPKTESGAPVVSNMMFSTANQTQTIGPFNTAGTFHYYCSIHPGMNLTVTVQ